MSAARKVAEHLLGSSTSPAMFLDPFCFKQFDDPGYVGTRIDADKAAFLQFVNDVGGSSVARGTQAIAPPTRPYSNRRTRQEPSL